MLFLSNAVTCFLFRIFYIVDDVADGLADKNGHLTNAGKLMADQHIVYNSKMFCTRWNGLEKGSIFDDALDE